MNNNYFCSAIGSTEDSLRNAHKSPIGRIHFFRVTLLLCYEEGGNIFSFNSQFETIHFIGKSI
jgi:hypothetical protein